MIAFSVKLTAWGATGTITPKPNHISTANILSIGKLTISTSIPARLGEGSRKVDREQLVTIAMTTTENVDEDSIGTQPEDTGYDLT